MFEVQFSSRQQVHFRVYYITSHLDLMPNVKSKYTVTFSDKYIINYNLYNKQICSYVVPMLTNDFSFITNCSLLSVFSIHIFPFHISIPSETTQFTWWKQYCEIILVLYFFTWFAFDTLDNTGRLLLVNTAPAPGD